MDCHAVSLVYGTQPGRVLRMRRLASDTVKFRLYSHQVSMWYLLTSFNKALLLDKSLIETKGKHSPHPPLYLPLQLVPVVYVVQSVIKEMHYWVYRKLMGSLHNILRVLYTAKEC
jgi:hypothetical protein